MKGDDNIPFVLVGNKADLEDRRRVSQSEAQQLADAWKVPYVETSAKTRLNVDRVCDSIDFHIIYTNFCKIFVVLSLILFLSLNAQVFHDLMRDIQKRKLSEAETSNGPKKAGRRKKRKCVIL